MKYFRQRRIRKNAKNLIRHSRHIRNMRGDLIRKERLCNIEDAENVLKRLHKQRADTGELQTACDKLLKALEPAIPQKTMPGLRENFEVIVVAVAVAMAFRAYFYQPFKIPTGSMKTTLYGIHSRYKPNPDWTDSIPAKYVKWLIYGEWHRTIKVARSGIMSQPTEHEERPDVYFIAIGGKIYKVPKDAVYRRELSHYPGEHVPAGTVLWSGIVTQGDHIFVDKMRWKVAKPERGQVIVFRTQGIKGLLPGAHYIKRLVGMPREYITLAPPEVLINGHAPTNAPIFNKIDYSLPRKEARSEYNLFLEKDGQTAFIPEGEYFVLGDNSKNSKDGRYWGTVPEENTVGPAVLVYWPISSRWGTIR